MKAPIMYTFFTLGQILTFMGHKMIKIWPMYKIPYNSSTISPRTNKNVSMCLSWPKDSNNMQHDLLGHIMTLTWPWPKVKVKYQMLKVILHIFYSLWHSRPYDSKFNVVSCSVHELQPITFSRIVTFGEVRQTLMHSLLTWPQHRFGFSNILNDV